MKPDVKKLVILNLPYLIFVYLFGKCWQAYRLAAGADLSGKLLHFAGGFTAAFADPVVASGYRTAKKQRELMDDKVDSFLAQGYSRSEAKSEAKKWVADVGYSEHQTGLAVDINADGVNSSGQQVYAWLADNAWKYGFILRYPEDKTEITKTDYEPWHYRYVGKEAAKEIYESGLCLEEYIGMMN